MCEIAWGLKKYAVCVHLPKVLGQLWYKIWFLLLHILQNSVVGFRDFYTCEGDR